MTALNFALMEAEPTLAAITPEDETQSLHAWSMADDVDTVIAYTPGRSWKIPALLAALATMAAVAAGAFLAWPESATKPLVAPAKPQVAAGTQAPPIVASPPIQIQSPDQRFITLLKQRNVVVVSPPLAINGAHETCTDLGKGYSAREIAEAGVRATPGENLDTAGTFVATAQEIYCPPLAAS
jgi:hypothetical protein